MRSQGGLFLISYKNVCCKPTMGMPDTEGLTVRT